MPPFRVDGDAIDVTTSDGNATRYTFTSLFRETEPQPNVYTTLCAGMIQKTCEGVPSTLLAYGETGSGKTYTLLGAQRTTTSGRRGSASTDNVSWQHGEHRGVLPRLIDDIFATPQISEVAMAVLEIYNEHVHDLLSPDPESTHVTMTENTRMRRIELIGCTTIICANAAEAVKSLERANSRRHTASTDANTFSSRSHMVVNLYLTTRRGVCEMKVVDLAGSECVEQTHAEGETFAEARAVNKSLSAFARVVRSLAEKSDHIPYRDSQLTRMLTFSLRNDCRIIVTLRPDHAQQTMSTLRFAHRVQNIKTPKTIVRRMSTIAELQTAVDRLEAELADRDLVISAYEQRLVATITTSSAATSPAPLPSARHHLPTMSHHDVMAFLETQADDMPVLPIETPPTTSEVMHVADSPPTPPVVTVFEPFPVPAEPRLRRNHRRTLTEPVLLDHSAVLTLARNVFEPIADHDMPDGIDAEDAEEDDAYEPAAPAQVPRSLGVLSDEVVVMLRSRNAALQQEIARQEDMRIAAEDERAIAQIALTASRSDAAPSLRDAVPAEVQNREVPEPTFGWHKDGASVMFFVLGIALILFSAACIVGVIKGDTTIVRSAGVAAASTLCAVGLTLLVTSLFGAADSLAAI